MQMVHRPMATLAVFLLSVAVSADATVHGSDAAARLSPVTGVVDLLKGMTKRIEKDGKTEEDLYESFVCWATSIIGDKKKSNSAASSRVDYLATYMDDLRNNRIELTSERVDLEKEQESLLADIEAAKQMREQEAKDFAMAQSEMQQAIDALTKAIEVLRTATKDHADGVLMALKGGLSEGNSVRAKEALALTQAVELGSRVLTKGDSVFLRRLLTGDVPERASWKKLNREATFKMDYKARSFKIQSVLAKLLETFASDLKDAASKEKDAIDTFNKLTKSKNAEKSAVEEALQKMEKENGAKSLSMSDASEEHQTLVKQISDDEGYITLVQGALSKKKSEWKARQVLRSGELAAISKAISILHGDDARDLFKKSFTSQGFLFLQEGSARRGDVHKVLRAVANNVHDSRLAALISAASSGHFDEVLSAIDSMLIVLRSEEGSDLKIKEDCESDRAADTRDAMVTSRQMDDDTDAITALEAKISELAAEIKEKGAQVDAINVELTETKEQREKENGEYLGAKKDDEDAAALVMQAKGVISTFYSENNLMLAQASKEPINSVDGVLQAGPKTWDGTYGGKTEETTGIIAILEMIHDDINQDINKATEDEKDADALYKKTKTNLESERGELSTAISNLDGEKGLAETDVTDTKKGRTSKGEKLKVIIKKIKDAAPGCDFITVNFQVRSKNRQIEIDGLEKAKAILSGGTFDGLPDPNREITPGDAALVQRQVRSKFLGRQS